MSAPNGVEKVPPVEGEMNKESSSSTSEPVQAVVPMEIDTAKNQPVPAMEPSTQEEAPAPTATDPGAQPSTGYSTIFVNHNEPDDSDDDFPVVGRKRKRNATNVDYLADMTNGAEPKEPSDKKTGWTWKGTQGPTWKGHEVKHGVPIGVWSLSDEPIDDRKHVLYGFLDPKFALHGRKYPERKDGSKYTGNFPSGTGTWAAKSDEWLLDAHLKGLSRKELTEYVRIRMATWKRDEVPQERDALNNSAVVEAKKIAAAAAVPIIKSENKGNSARKGKKGTPRKSNGAKFDNSTPRGSFGEPFSPNNKSATKGPEQDYTPSGKREAPAPATSNGSPLGKRVLREPKMDAPLPKSTPKAQPSNHGSLNQLAKPEEERSKFVVMGKDVLLGYWKDSSEHEVMNKHAMYGVIQSHGVFRVKVVPETRYGKFIKNGNYPKQSGGCWVNYDTIVFEKYLKDLVRTEIEEYCRICVVDPEYSSGNQGRAIDRAVTEAKRRVAEKAAEKGLNIIEYNRKRVDQLEQGAIARGAEKQRKSGETVVTPAKADVKPTAKRSDKAASDARAQMVRLAKKEAKEARERETLNSRGDADLAEAMRRSTTEQEALALAAQKKSNLNSAAAPAAPGTETTWTRHAKDLPSAYNSLRQGSGTPMPEANGGNGSESDNVKFYLLDRETQRVKMERWCKLKPTSQYHTMDREGQKRHVEKHIDQLIARQTGAALSRRPKKRSRTGDYPGPSQAQPGAVTAPSPLADMTRAASSPAKSATTSQEPAATFATADTLRARNGPIILAPAPPAAPEFAAPKNYSRTQSPAAKQEVPYEPRTNLTLRSVLNEPITPIQSENEVTPQPKPVGTTADVQMADAPFEPPAAPVQRVTTNSSTPAVSRATSAHPMATVETEALQYQQRALSTQPPAMESPASKHSSASATIQPTPTELAAAKQLLDSALLEAISRSATPVAAATDVYMSDAPLSSTPAHHDWALHPEQQHQNMKPQFLPPHLQQHLYTTPQNPRAPIDNSQGFMSAPSRPYVTPYPTPTPSATAPSTAPIPRAAAPPAAPEIFTGHDGVKYSVDPGSEFGELLVSVDRELVDVEDVEYTRQLVLVAKKAPRPARAKGKEVKWGEEVFRRAGEGVFCGFLVGGERKVTRVGGEEFVKFVVLVPF